MQLTLDSMRGCLELGLDAIGGLDGLGLDRVRGVHDGLLGAVVRLAGGIVSLLGLLDDERRKDVGLDLELVELGRRKRWRAQQASNPVRASASRPRRD